VEGPQRPRHQPAVRQLSAADGDIDALLDQVHDPVGKVEIEADLGILRHELRQDRDEEVVGDHRAGDTDAAARRLARAHEALMRVVEIIEDAPAALMEGAAFLGQAQAAGGALDEPDAELVLQLRHRLPNSRRRQAKHPPRRDEATEIGRAHERGQAGETIHSSVSFRIHWNECDLNIHPSENKLIRMGRRHPLPSHRSDEPSCSMLPQRLRKASPQGVRSSPYALPPSPCR
jgi:hypothetical protein